MTDEAKILAELRRTNRLLAGVIVQVARTQTNDRNYLIETLAGLGLQSRQIAEAIGTTEATVNVTRTRRRRRELRAADAVDPVPASSSGTSTREK